MSGRVTFVTPVALLDPARSTFHDMLQGFAVSMRSRGLAVSTIEVQVWGIRRFHHFVGEYPWMWKPQDVEDYSSSLLSRGRPLAHSTIRGYQNTIKSFCSYLSNPAYDWYQVCLERFGVSATASD